MFKTIVTIVQTRHPEASVFSSSGWIDNYSDPFISNLEGDFHNGYIVNACCPVYVFPQRHVISLCHNRIIQFVQHYKEPQQFGIGEINIATYSNDCILTNKVHVKQPRRREDKLRGGSQKLNLMNSDTRSALKNTVYQKRIGHPLVFCFICSFPSAGHFVCQSLFPQWKKRLSI